ncbi:unnamed protein product [Sphagnum balticum]
MCGTYRCVKFNLECPGLKGFDVGDVVAQVPWGACRVFALGMIEAEQKERMENKMCRQIFPGRMEPNVAIDNIDATIGLHFIIVGGRSKLLIAGQELEVIAAPGHMDGHLALLHRMTGTLLIGEYCVGIKLSCYNGEGGYNILQLWIVESVYNQSTSIREELQSLVSVRERIGIGVSMPSRDRWRDVAEEVYRKALVF